MPAKKQTTVEKRAQAAIEAQNGASTPSELLRVALDKGAGVDALERLLAMHERMEASQARKAFFDALARFQAACPDVMKLDQAHNNAYAKLPRIIKAIRQDLHDCGLTYRFEMADTDGGLSVTCVLTHRDGHEERTSMSGAPDTSGSKNALQARASTVTYLERYSLCGALGIVTVDPDDDGGAPQEVEAINKAQAATLNGLLKQLPPEYRKRMLDAYGIADVAELPAASFVEACKALNRHIERLERATSGELL